MDLGRRVEQQRLGDLDLARLDGPAVDLEASGPGRLAKLRGTVTLGTLAWQAGPKLIFKA